MFGTALLLPSQDELELEVVRVVVAVLPARCGNGLIRQLCALEPMHELKHLKRLRKSPQDDSKLEALLYCLATDKPLQQPVGQGEDGNAGQRQQRQQQEANDDPAQPASAGSAQAVAEPASNSGDTNTATTSLPMDSLPDHLLPLALQHSVERLFEARASRHAPQTRQQWERWGQLWPVTWRIPENGPAVTTEAPAAPHLQRYFELHMERAVRLAQRVGVANAAVLVDPSNGAVVAQAADASAAHPLQHAVMAAIHAAAERDLRLWPDSSTSSSSSSSSNGGVASSNGSGSQLPPAAVVGGACGATPSNGATGDRGSGACCCTEARGAGNGGGGVCSAQGPDGELCPKRQRLGSGPGPDGPVGHDDGNVPAPPPDPGPKPYMCTGFDCFTLVEPCAMCAMGLVHSRVQRVVYCRPDPHGALGSRFRLHLCRTLNHTYQVYRMPLLPLAADAAEGGGVAGGRDAQPQDGGGGDGSAGGANGAGAVDRESG